MSHIPDADRQLKIPRSLVPVAAALVLQACSFPVGERPSLVEGSEIEQQISADSSDNISLAERGEQIEIVVSTDETEQQNSALYSEYFFSSERHEDLATYVEESVTELYRLAERDPELRLSIIGRNDDLESPNDRPYLLIEGTIAGDYFRVLSFGRDDPRAIFRTDDGVVNFMPETLMINLVPADAPTDYKAAQPSADVFIGGSSESIGYVTSYTDLRINEQGSMFFDQASVYEDGVHSKSRTYSGSKGEESGPIVDMHAAMNVDSYVQHKVTAVIETLTKHLHQPANELPESR